MILFVEKRYIRRKNGDIKTLTGSLATDDPEKDKKAMDERSLSSIDPRIQWDEEFEEGDGGITKIIRSISSTLRKLMSVVS